VSGVVKVVQLSTRDRYEAPSKAGKF